jgi:hypothetical protein
MDRNTIIIITVIVGIVLIKRSWDGSNSIEKVIEKSINTFTTMDNVVEKNKDNKFQDNKFHQNFYNKHHVNLNRYLGWRRWFMDNKLKYNVQPNSNFQDIPTRKFLDNMKDEPLNNELTMININPNIIIY